MKYYGIYQFYVGNFNQEKYLLVGKQLANSKNEAIENHLSELHNDDVSQKEFVKGYLQAVEVTEKSYNSDFDNDIDHNRKIIARFI